MLDEASELIGRERILIVDDNAQLRESMGRLLMRAGFRCEFAADVPEAGALLEQRSWDVVLCDINMPGGSGLALARDIVSGDPATAVVMVTASDGEDIADTAAEFARQTIELITQPSARQRIGEAARTLVESRYSWPTVTNAVEQALLQATRIQRTH